MLEVLRLFAVVVTKVLVVSFNFIHGFHHHHHCFASVSMLAWFGRGFIMALLHILRSWAISGFIFILLRSLLINWGHVFLGLPCSHLPSTLTCLQALAGF